ncbi:MAG: carbohydrate-binding protein [Bacteroidetes bacterium]|nr:carbohydrate-binding protein [Bacteroidota bacterium]
MKTHISIIAILIGLFFMPELYAQGFLHTDGKNIVNGAGENVILRGIGTGNWMLQEGYMMQAIGVAGTQHEFREKLIQTIGEVKTDSFYNVWLKNHFTRTDVDSMKVWGFNSVRVAMHYKWFTLPIEDEPVQGENTWLDKGFEMMDSLLAWCGDNEMYLILDLHGAPGGQGANADISDYDPTKPSLWESQENKDKTVALWRRLAERYADAPWIGGYDLINETNWTFPEGNNSQLRALFENITTAIREVDTNHILFIEGNSYANNHSELTPPWDDNFVYSFHKYWSGTGPKDLDWILTLRDSYNVPLWMGESGENSNTWYTDLIYLCESNNIGWSWWPVKKSSINNILNVTFNQDYADLIKYWKGEIATPPTEEEAFQAVLQLAENHKIENCKIQYDVIDAMIRQPQTDEVIPFTKHQLTEPIFFTDFDYGKNGFAYYDEDVAYYGGDWTGWNNGWGYRSDGVDIEVCQDSDPANNGYNVGWTEDGEWVQYSMRIDSVAVYTLEMRSASAAGGSEFHIEVNDADVTQTLSLPITGGWQSWQTSTYEDIILPAGEVKVKFEFDKGGSNLNYFNFKNPQSAESVEFVFISAETSNDGSAVHVALNKSVSTPEAELLVGDFELLSDNNELTISSVSVNENNAQVLVLNLANKVNFNNVLTLSYNGGSVKSNDQLLAAFYNAPVANNLPERHTIPGRIEAEAFIFNNGLVLENCSEGGQNTGYANAGDYLDYLVHVSTIGYYEVAYRVASERNDAEIIFQIGEGDNFISLDTVKFTSTNGWQNWSTQYSSVYLEEGYYTIRLLVKQSEHNLNWFELGLTVTSSTKLEKGEKNKYSLYPNPNPGSQHTILKANSGNIEHHEIKVFTLDGKVMETINGTAPEYYIHTSGYAKGMYIVQIRNNSQTYTKKLIIQ